MRRPALLVALLLVLGATAGLGAAHASAAPEKSLLFHDGTIVRTVLPPAASQGPGTDPFFMVTNGVSGQLGIAGVAPGDPGYHGGHWAVEVVAFTGTPYLLTSAAAVQAAEAAGDVTVTRTPSLDFLCPVQP